MRRRDVFTVEADGRLRKNIAQLQVWSNVLLTEGLYGKREVDSKRLAAENQSQTKASSCRPITLTKFSAEMSPNEVANSASPRPIYGFHTISRGLREIFVPAECL